MRKIFLEPVDNGLIYTASDDNIDGAGKKFEKKELFVLKDNINETERFLNFIIQDLGLFTGNPIDKQNLVLKKDYGIYYNLSNTEVQEERKKLSVKLNKLKRIKEKNIEFNDNESIKD